MKVNGVEANTLLVAIRAKCMDCSGNSRTAVEQCCVRYCPLYPYRSVRAIVGESKRILRGQISMLDVLASQEVKQGGGGG